ncbi:MAG TPA: protein kinase, partial [Pseudonocardia sp.]|nr:protein kinase [Pseudonocardia sp.]
MEGLRTGDPAGIGLFRLLARLGAGGMGEVFLGRGPDRELVAVKVVYPGLATDPRFRARFAREVATGRAVRARWVAPVLDADPEAPRPWLATEYIVGPGLDRAVRETGPLPEAAVGQLAVRLASALAELRGLGVVHRDLKPSNVLLAADGPRLIDFGIARAVDSTAITLTGTVLGPPGYMSPEQALGEEAGSASDVFSLAGVLVYATTGRAPFGESGNPVVLLRRIIDEEPDLTGVPGGLHDLLLACLSKQPGERPAAETLGERLAGYRDEPGCWPPPAIAALLVAPPLPALPPRTMLAPPVPVTVPVTVPAGPEGLTVAVDPLGADGLTVPVAARAGAQGLPPTLSAGAQGLPPTLAAGPKRLTVPLTAPVSGTAVREPSPISRRAVLAGIGVLGVGGLVGLGAFALDRTGTAPPTPSPPNVAPPIVAPPGPSPRWTSPTSDRVDALEVAGDVVYVGSGSVVQALDAGSGAPRWRYDTVLNGHSPLGDRVSLSTAGGQVCVSTGGGVTALDAATGRPRWTAAASGVSGLAAMVGTQVAAEENVVFATVGNLVAALDPATGHVRWSHRVADRFAGS